MIEFRCACGALCRADESEVGRLVRCEACGLDVPVPAAETEASATAADDLREQLGGGGAADIAAHLHDGEDEATRTEAAAAAEKRRKDAEALRQQLGSGGAADIAKALRSEDAGEVGPEAGAAPAVGEGGPEAGPALAEAAPGVGEAGSPSAAPAAPSPKKKVLRGRERAEHHITFKRVIWVPALLVGLVCLAVGVCAGGFRIHPLEIPDLLAGKPDLYAMHMARFREKLEQAHIPVDGFDIVEHGGEAWAVPEGTEHRKTNAGRVYYTNAAGFDEPAVNAEDYTKSQAIEQRSQSGLLWFGAGLVAVGLVLVVLSAILYRDVRLVRSARAEAEAEKAAGAVESPPAPRPVSEPGEGESDKPAGGEDAGTTESEAEPPDASPRA